jgi:signal transduction histidine kinase
MNSRLLVTSSLFLALLWGITPGLLTLAHHSGVLIRSNGVSAIVWFGVSLFLTAAAFVMTGYGGRWRIAVIWGLLLIVWIIYPQRRTLITVRADTPLSLLWLLTAVCGTALLLIFIGQRMRRRAEYEEQTRLLFSIIDHGMHEGMALVDQKLQIRWSNQAARDYLIRDAALIPDAERLVRRTLDTQRSASQSYTLDETTRVSLQSVPQDTGLVSLFAYPLNYETGPNQFYERFIRRIVHDMRNPLAAIIAHASNLQSGGTLDNSSAATIEGEAQRLTRLVDSMLFDARLSYVPLALEQIDLLDVIEEVYYQYDERAMRENKTVILETQPEAAPIEADRDLLVRALSNLVDNSLKYSHEGAEVRLTLEATSQNYLLKVIDTGDGIPAEYLPDRIFEPLVRARKKDSGSGLGLAIVKKIVELHHGDISVESELGKGTIFTLCLPASA